MEISSSIMYLEFVIDYYKHSRHLPRDLSQLGVTLCRIWFEAGHCCEEVNLTKPCEKYTHAYVLFG